MNRIKRLTLAIETAVGGGSLSISDGAREIDFWIGNREISKAEDVLENLGKLLKINDLTKSEIRTIAVSAKTGSATGLKIGLALAKGLAKGLESELRVVPLISAIKKSVILDDTCTSMIALPISKNSIYLQYFSDGGIETSSTTVSADAFVESLETSRQTEVFAYQSVFETTAQHTKKTHNLGGNLAKYICFVVASDNE